MVKFWGSMYFMWESGGDYTVTTVYKLFLLSLESCFMVKTYKSTVLYFFMFGFFFLTIQGEHIFVGKWWAHLLLEQVKETNKSVQWGWLGGI